MLAKILEEIDCRFENLIVADDECRKTALSKHSYEQAKYFQNLIFSTKRAKDIVEEIIRKHLSGKDTNAPTNDGWIPEEIEEALKQMYLEVANNYDISDLHYDGDKVACVASRCRQVAISLVREIFQKHMNDDWIPVEKCLPEDGRDVLVTKSTGKVEMITFNKFLYEHPEYSHGVKVTAWQPLPEPYRPEKGE